MDVAPLDVWSERRQLSHHRQKVAFHLRIIELPPASPVLGVANPGERKSAVVPHVRLDFDDVETSSPLRVRAGNSEHCQCQRYCHRVPQFQIRKPHSGS